MFLVINEHVNALLLVITVCISVFFVSNNTITLANKNLGNLKITDIKTVLGYNVGLSLTLHHSNGMDDSTPFLLKIHLWVRLRSHHQ